MHEMANKIVLFLVVILFHKLTAGFNLQISNGYLSPGYSNENFGYSMTIAKTKQGNRITVGAPRHRGRSNNREGGVYNCYINNVVLNTSTPCELFNAVMYREKVKYFSCDFENCTLEQASVNDEFDWIKWEGTTPTTKTGPIYDHTLQDRGGGHYMLLESSRPRSVGQAAIMKTPLLPRTNETCIRFWYCMYGASVGSLNIYMESVAYGMEMVWYKEGNWGHQWVKGWVSHYADHPYKVLIEGIVGTSIYSDIAIDDVTIESGYCEEDGSMVNSAFGATIAKNNKNDDVLLCAPSWTNPLCKTQYHVSGLCYKLNKELDVHSMETLTPCKPQRCTEGKLDLVFVFDGSTSILEGGFQNMKLWLRNLASSFPLGADKTQIAIVQYSETPQTEFNLTDFTTLTELREAINDIKYLKGNTNTGSALQYCHNEIFNVQRGMRSDAKQVAVVITDGKSTDSVDEAATMLKQDGIKIFAVGVGLSNYDELNSIASDPDHQFVYTVDSYTALDNIKAILRKKISGLESHDRTFTTENCQAGLSATFSGDKPVLGIIGYEDWNGGVTVYNDSHSPIILGFKKLLTNAFNFEKSYIEKTSQHIEHGNTVRKTRTSSRTKKSSRITYTRRVLRTRRMKTKLRTRQKRNAQYVSESLNPEGINWLDELQLQLTNKSREMQEDKLNKILSLAYFGYSLASGSVTGVGKHDIVIGSPRLQSTGAAFVISMHGDDIALERMYKGPQLGSYFGSCVCVADINGDHVDDLMIGAPLWTAQYADMGKVTLYLSDTKRGNVVHTQHDIMGLVNKSARFGTSIASPGDLNMDGFNDFVVGAPSSEGSIYIFNGGLRASQITKPSQVIAASDFNHPLQSFGNFISNGADLDGNGYKDFACSALGSDKVLLLYSRPVINVKANVTVDPQEIDILNASCYLNSTIASFCSRIRICLRPVGVNIREEFSLITSWQVDSGRPLGKSRAHISGDSLSEIMVRKNQETCIQTTMIMKEPVRDISDDILISLAYKLNDNETTNNMSPLLSMYDENPIIAKAKFIRNCSSNACATDLKILCVSRNPTVYSSLKQTYITVVNDRSLLEIDFSVINNAEDAYDTIITVTYESFLYLSQLSQESNCFEIFDKYDKHTDTQIIGDCSHEGGNNTENQTDCKTKLLTIIVKNPVMQYGKSCSAILKFGFLRSHNFTGGLVDVVMSVTNANNDTNLFDNVCQASLPVYYEGSFNLNGNSAKDAIYFGRFYDERKESVMTYNEIGPEVSHVFDIYNSGKSTLPVMVAKFSWPTETLSKHDILYLTSIDCEPKDVCSCEDADLFINSENVNTTELMYMDMNRGNGDVVISADNTTLSQETKFKQIHIDCTMLGITCETITCSVQRLNAKQSVKITMNFRLWEATLVQAGLWRTLISTTVVTKFDEQEYMIIKSKTNSEQVTTIAYNELLQMLKDNEVKASSLKIWVIIAAVITGFILLGLIMLALYKAEFFESKYKKQKEETMDWQDFEMYKASSNEKASSNINNNRESTLSTFQRRSLPATPTE